MSGCSKLDVMVNMSELSLKITSSYYSGIHNPCPCVFLA